MTENTTNQSWTLRIRPQEKLWQVHLGEIWRYRDLFEKLLEMGEKLRPVNQWG